MATNQNHVRKGVSSYSAPFDTDYERQQAENYPGTMLQGRYYLRPRKNDNSGLNGPGFALGSLPYNTRPHIPKVPIFRFTPEPGSYPLVAMDSQASNNNPEISALEKIGNYFSSLLQSLIAFLSMIYFGIKSAISISAYHSYIALERTGNHFSSFFQSLVAFLKMTYFGIISAIRVSAYHSYAAFLQAVHFLNVLPFISSKAKFVSFLLIALTSLYALYFPIPIFTPFSDLHSESETTLSSLEPVVSNTRSGFKGIWFSPSNVIFANLSDPLPQNVSPTFTRRYLIKACRIFMELPSDLSYKWQPNFASSKVETRIVYPDTPAFKVKTSGPGSEFAYFMEASQALEDSMEPGHCWPFSAQGGKLSFRLPFKVRPTRFIIHHPESSNEAPPSSISLLAHVPLAEHRRGMWKMVTSGILHWQASPDTSSLFAEFDTSDVTFEASHYRLMAYLDQDAGAEAQFGCVYKIDLKGKIQPEQIPKHEFF
ncbi:hypothetical protein DSO57_1035106 [Entomophthora muscae]|uniref:Uncharacterized protein n=1 Tax=Entomophthora muscae TaxID=34485 RepID=A0ACC2SZR1_9FUNG|nr:hypothetical protein DSO57_1035106 [Entomophthora muscae]